MGIPEYPLTIGGKECLERRLVTGRDTRDQFDIAIAGWIVF
jgi:hypothetical protein